MQGDIMRIRLISDLSPPVQMNNILNRKGYGNPRACGLSVVFFVYRQPLAAPLAKKI